MPRKNDRPSKRTPRTIIKDFLGESTASTSETDESFRSPSTDVGVTRYSLNFSSAKRNTTTKSAKKETPKKRTESPKKHVKEVDKRRASRSLQSENTDEESNIDVDQSQQSRRSSPRKRVSPTPGPSRMVPTAKSSKNAHKSIPKRKHISNKNIPNVYREIISLQQSTSLQLRKLPFSRVIREILMMNNKEGMRITPEALMALQESAELYLTILFQDANLCTIHRDRKTLHPKDLRLVRYLRGVTDPGN